MHTSSHAHIQGEREVKVTHQHGIEKDKPFLKQTHQDCIEYA